MSPRLRYSVTPEDTVVVTFGPGVFARVPSADAKAFALALLDDLGDARGHKRPGPSSEAHQRHIAILRRLVASPCGAADLCAASGEIPGYISRTMGDLVKRGFAMTDANGRGRKATYSITPLGLDRLRGGAA